MPHTHHAEAYIFLHTCISLELRTAANKLLIPITESVFKK